MALAYQWLPLVDISAYSTENPRTTSECGYIQNRCMFNTGHQWLDLDYSNYGVTIGAETSQISADTAHRSIINSNYEVVLLKTDGMDTYSGSSGGTFGAPLSSTAYTTSGFNQLNAPVCTVDTDFSVILVSKGNKVFEGDLLTGYTEHTVDLSHVGGWTNATHALNSYMSPTGDLIAGGAIDSNGETGTGFIMQKQGGTWYYEYPPNVDWTGGQTTIKSDGSQIYFVHGGNSNIVIAEPAGGWNTNETTLSNTIGNNHSKHDEDHGFILSTIGGGGGSNFGGVRVDWLDGSPSEIINGDTQDEYAGSAGVWGAVPTADGALYFLTTGFGTGILKPLLLTDFPTAGEVIPDFWTKFQGALER